MSEIIGSISQDKAEYRKWEGEEKRGTICLVAMGLVPQTVFILCQPSQAEHINYV
jgi:hypothetical protein